MDELGVFSPIHLIHKEFLPRGERKVPFQINKKPSPGKWRMDRWIG